VITTYIVVAFVSYLLGSIPFGYILVKLFLKQDIRATGSGNIGATNVARSGAKGLAIATLLLDAGKGFLAVVLTLITFAYGAAHDAQWALTLAAFAGLCAVLGHMFPVWLRFRGGKGVATAVGAFAVLAPEALGIALLVFLAITAVTRFVSLGSILASIVFPLVAYFHPPEEFIHYGDQTVFSSLLCVTSFLIVSKHHENIRRLIAGTENKFGGKKSVPPPDVVEKQA
jgi:acyl phosphate:glycerol-3-phosphate acyltransferase